MLRYLSVLNLAREICKQLAEQKSLDTTESHQFLTNVSITSKKCKYLRIIF